MLLLACFCSMAGAGEPRVNEQGQIEAEGKDLRVFRDAVASPLFGKVERKAGVVCFTPALPLVAGEMYRVETQGADERWHTQHVRFEMPKAKAPAVSIAPSPVVLPANALKIYLHFTQPMEQGVFLERITLQRQDGSIVAGAFRETELWSPDGRRLTLWFHPGRQKTGVNLNRDEGPVLRAGERGTLKIAGSWRSAAGVALGGDALFNITAGQPDHVCPDPRRWVIKAPKAGSRDPLELHFHEALDPALLVSSLSVWQDTSKVTGEVRTAADALSWSFTPAANWNAGAHHIEIDPLLEDLAGNNLHQPFEVDRDLPPPVANPDRVGFTPRS